MLGREFHAESLDESLAERRQFLDWRCARLLDGGDAPAADGDDQRDDPSDGALLDRRLGAAVIRREEQNEAPLRYQGGMPATRVPLTRQVGDGA